MVQGIVKLARNSGEISNIIAEVVYSNDKFVYRPGIDPHPAHDPDWFGDRGSPLGVYAVVTLSDGEKVTTIMPQNRIMEIAGNGNNATQYMPGKGPNYVEWWRKTVIKNALKYCPKSTSLDSQMKEGHDDLDTAVVIDGEAEMDVPKVSREIKLGIAQAKTRKQLIGLQQSITELPLEHQEELVTIWNEKAIELKNKEGAKPSESGGLPEHHAVNPSTGEILQADMA